ncbi:hypothetical protein QYM36_009300 [Artemia franciscana]|uniref:Uncharacterized protein n=1 Tax=Artemia franciscana TaxID=6661 RepID=A0AA88L9N4_ARTSF|nr:hypothetical protein QYM36_009300 [Artemia franciscana]
MRSYLLSELHETYLDLDPIVSVPLKARKCIQINLRFKKSYPFLSFQGLKKDYYFPVLWVEEKGVNESTIAKYASDIFRFADVKDAQKDFWGVCRVKNQSGEEERRRCRGVPEAWGVASQENSHETPMGTEDSYLTINTTASAVAEADQVQMMPDSRSGLIILNKKLKAGS